MCFLPKCLKCCNYWKSSAQYTDGDTEGSSVGKHYLKPFTQDLHYMLCAMHGHTQEFCCLFSPSRCQPFEVLSKPSSACTAAAFPFSTSSAFTNKATSLAFSWSTKVIKTDLVVISFCQISGCVAGYCSTTTLRPLHWQSCTFWSCGWGPSTWNTGSRTPAEASWCSTIWASHSCLSTCSMR